MNVRIKYRNRGKESAQIATRMLQGPDEIPFKSFDDADRLISRLSRAIRTCMKIAEFLKLPSKQRNEIENGFFVLLFNRNYFYPELRVREDDPYYYNYYHHEEPRSRNNDERHSVHPDANEDRWSITCHLHYTHDEAYEIFLGRFRDFLRDYYPDLLRRRQLATWTILCLNNTPFNELREDKTPVKDLRKNDAPVTDASTSDPILKDSPRFFRIVNNDVIKIIARMVNKDDPTSDDHIQHSIPHKVFK